MQKKTTNFKPSKKQATNKVIAKTLASPASKKSIAGKTLTGRDLLEIFFKHPVKKIPLVINNTIVGILHKEKLFAPAEDAYFLKSPLKPAALLKLTSKENISTFLEALEKQKQPALQVPFLVINTNEKNSHLERKTTTETNANANAKLPLNSTSNNNSSNANNKWQGATLHQNISSTYDFLLQFLPITRLGIRENITLLNMMQTAVCCFNCRLSMVYCNASAASFLINHLSGFSTSSYSNKYKIVKGSLEANQESSLQEKGNLKGNPEITNAFSLPTNHSLLYSFEKNKKRNNNESNNNQASTSSSYIKQIINAAENFSATYVKQLVLNSNLTKFAKRIAKNWQNENYHFTASILSAASKSETNKSLSNNNEKNYFSDNEKNYFSAAQVFNINVKKIANAKPSTPTKKKEKVFSFKLSMQAMHLNGQHIWLVEILP